MRAQAGAEIFTHRCRVYYEDTDFTGLVYHANYVRYFERGRSDFLRAIGVGHADLLVGEGFAGAALVGGTVQFLALAWWLYHTTRRAALAD